MNTRPGIREIREVRGLLLVRYMPNRDPKYVEYVKYEVPYSLGIRPIATRVRLSLPSYPSQKRGGVREKYLRDGRPRTSRTSRVETGSTTITRV